jgi:hypothetical protein
MKLDARMIQAEEQQVNGGADGRGWDVLAEATNILHESSRRLDQLSKTQTVIRSMLCGSYLSSSAAI